MSNKNYSLIESLITYVYELVIPLYTKYIIKIYSALNSIYTVREKLWRERDCKEALNIILLL
jgi:hypothetical protein